MKKICLFTYLDNNKIPLKREITNIIGGYAEVCYSKTKADGTYSRVDFIKKEHVKEFTKLKLQDDYLNIIMFLNIHTLFLFNISVEDRSKLVTNEEVIKHTKIVDYDHTKERIIVVSAAHGTYETLGR